MESYEPYLSLGVALTAGLVIGFEREQSRPEREAEGTRPVGGARTHPLVSLTGGISGLLVPQLGWVPLVLTGLMLLTFLGVAYWNDVRRGEQGLTSEVAMVASFMLGVLATTRGAVGGVEQRLLLVLSATVVVALLLSMKVPLHSFVRRVSSGDLFSTLKFLLLAVVVLPLLPDRTLDPYQVLNPRKIALLVVLISGLGFLGYVAVRLLGPHRGLGMTGLLGGLVSSTAVTLSSARRAKEEPALAPACALAIVLASSIMFVRVLVAVAVVNRALVGELTTTMLGMAGAGLLASGVFYLRSRNKGGKAEEVRFANPFELSSALKFGLLFVAVLFVSKLATTHFGEGATYVAGVLAGTTDVDAITLSMANLVHSGLDARVAVTTILLATASNTAVKAGLAMVIGGWRFGLRIALAFAAVVAVGAASLLLVWSAR